MKRDRISMKLCICRGCTESRCLEINETTTKVVNGNKVDEVKQIAGPMMINSDEEKELRELAFQLRLLSTEMDQMNYAENTPELPAEARS